MPTSTTAMKTNFLQRLVGAALLDASVYEEVEADASATAQACVTVIMSSVAAGVGIGAFGSRTLPTIAFWSVMALLAWAAWALVTFELGSRIMPQPQTRSSIGELLRTLGFASAPGCLRVFGAVPGATIPVFAVTAVWMLAAMVVAIRQALDYQSTARAVAVCVVGWLMALAFVIAIGMLFGPTLS
jgi:hypothetical protein